MNEPIKNLLASGIIESYVLGMTDAAEEAELAALSTSFPELKDAIAAYEKELESHLFSKAVEPSENIKAELMAKIDYQQRLDKGEEMSMPPLLNKNSSATDYRQWLSMPAMYLPADADNITAKIIGANTTTSIAIVWIKKGTPEEVHIDELETFLILEGTCIITVGHTRHLLSPGDQLSIPLHVPHHVVITSSIPCKAILQRIAA